MRSARLSWPFSDSQSHLRDIIGAIDDIQQFTEGLGAAAFHADAKTRAAVERKFLVIGEAASRLGDQAARLCPGMPWQNIRGIGKRIRHGYDTVNPEILWNTVQDHLPSLRAAVTNALRSSEAPNPKPEP